MTQNGLTSRLPKIPLNGPGRVKLRFVKMLGPKFGWIFEGLLAVQYFYAQNNMGIYATNKKVAVS